MAASRLDDADLRLAAQTIEIDLSDDTSGQEATLLAAKEGHRAVFLGGRMDGSGAGTLKFQSDDGTTNTDLTGDFALAGGSKDYDVEPFRDWIVAPENEDLQIVWTSGTGTRTLDGYAVVAYIAID